MSIKKDQAAALIDLWNTLFPFSNTRPLTESGKLADGAEEADKKAFLHLATSYNLSYQNLVSLCYFFETKQQYYRPASRIAHLFKPKPETPYLLSINGLLTDWQHACSCGQWEAIGDDIEDTGPSRLDRIRAQAEKAIEGERQISQRRAGILAVIEQFDTDAEHRRKKQVAREIEQLTESIPHGP